MTHAHSALIAQLDALEGADPASVFAELIRAGLQALIDAEATEVLGAGRYERSSERTTYRNGTRPKTVSTTSGDVEDTAPLAIQVGKLRSFVFEKVNAIVATPYQCEMLQDLNQNATELVTQLNVPMPPMVNNLMGARILVEDFNPATQPPEGTGLVALHVDKPEMFVGMASMMLPGFEALDLANQKNPVRIPEEMLHMEGLEVSALMVDSAIGASVGAQQSKKLKAFMAAKPQDGGTFFSLSYDMARQVEIQNEMAKKWNYDSTDQDQESPHDELTEAFKESYMAMLGRSRVDMRFDGHGLVIDSLMTFK